VTNSGRGHVVKTRKPELSWDFAQRTSQCMHQGCFHHTPSISSLIVSHTVPPNRAERERGRASEKKKRVSFLVKKKISYYVVVMVSKHHSHRHFPTLLSKQVERERKHEEEQEPRVRRHKVKPITVHVQILTGRKFSLSVDRAHDTLDDIREKIRSKEGIHPDQQLLLYNGIKLPDGITAPEMLLQEGSTLYLTLRNRGG
jgi:hypothetical protein